LARPARRAAQRRFYSDRTAAFRRNPLKSEQISPGPSRREARPAMRYPWPPHTRRADKNHLEYFLKI
jgi:hypothetical protein